MLNFSVFQYCTCPSFEALKEYWQEDKINWHIYVKKTKLEGPKYPYSFVIMQTC